METGGFEKQLKCSYQLNVHNAFNQVKQGNVIVDDKNLSKKKQYLLQYNRGLQVPHVNEDYDPINIALNKFADHPDILKQKKNFNKPIEFNSS